MAKSMNKKQSKLEIESEESQVCDVVAQSKVTFREGLLAWLPYILLCILILIASPLFPSINEFLAKFTSKIQVYTGEGAKSTSFIWINTPGMMIIISTFMAGLIQKVKISIMLNVFISTIKQLTKSFITITSIVAISKIMSYSGMTSSISFGLCATTGSFYPIISPLLGSIGTFVTGSDTSANILFGGLQTQAATSLGISPYWIAAANTAGATAGKMISPQSIAIAASATGLIGKEGKIFSSTVKFCLGYVIILGILVYFGSYFFTI
jgi:lactate permease